MRIWPWAIHHDHKISIPIVVTRSTRLMAVVSNGVSRLPRRPSASAPLLFVPLFPLFPFPVLLFPLAEQPFSSLFRSDDSKTAMSVLHGCGADGDCYGAARAALTTLGKYCNAKSLVNKGFLVMNKHRNHGGRQILQVSQIPSQDPTPSSPETRLLRIQSRSRT